MHQTYSFHTISEEFEKRKTQAGKSHNHCDIIIFKKLNFQKPAFSNSNGLKHFWKALFSWWISVDSRPTTPNRTVAATARNTTMSSKQMNSSPSPPPIQCCLSLKTNAYNSCFTQDNIEGGRGGDAIQLTFGILPRVTVKSRSFFKLSQVVLSRVVAAEIKLWRQISLGECVQDLRDTTAHPKV